MLRSALVLAALFLAANANHDAGVSDPNGADQPNLCPGDKCDCKYNCKKKCHCNGWHRGGANGPDCESLYNNKRHCYTDPNVCDETFASGSEKMPGTDIAMHWAYAACDDVEKQKDDEVTTTSTTTKSTRTHQKGHDGVQCTDYNEHDTRDHTCHWCYEKVDSAEYLNGNWLTASFNVLIEKTKAEGGDGMFHIGLTTSAGRNIKVGWYEIGVYSTSFFVRRAKSPNRWNPSFDLRTTKFGHNKQGTRGELWIKFNSHTGQFLIGHGRCVGKRSTILMDWTDEAPFPVDRFEVQGYENTEADFNICHESCDVSECEVDDAEVCKGMHGWTSTSTTVTGTTVTTTKTQTTTTTTTTTATTQTTTSSTTTTKKVCGAGQYRDDRSNTCNACPANTFQSREQHTQTECMQPRKCTAAEVIKDAASAVSDTICATSQPCSTGEYESKAPTPGVDERECSQISECVEGEFVKEEATEASDRVCVPCDGSTASFDGGCSTTTTTTTTTSTTTTTTTTTTITATTTTATTTTTTTESTTTTVTSTSMSADALAIIDDIKLTYDKVQGQAQDCYDTITNGGAKLYCSTPENCYSSCTALESIATKVSARLDDVRNNRVDFEAEQSNGPSSPLTPDVVPAWCSDTDVNCAAYGDSICSTSEVSICAAYCGCPMVTNTDFDASAGASTGGGTSTGGDTAPTPLPGKSNSTATAIAVVAAIVVLAIVGAVAYVKMNQGGAGDEPEGIVAFDNPAYASADAADGGVGYHEPTALQSSAGYMDVAPQGTNQQSASGYMDVTAPAAASGGAADAGFGGYGESSDEEV